MYLKNIQVIEHAVRIAGLFHDFGKANFLFQERLLSLKCKRKYEPYRHEWISLRLFQLLVDNKTDEEWLNDLIYIKPLNIENLIKDGIDKQSNPFKKNHTSQFSTLIKWLILSHHKLPISPENTPKLDSVDNWLQHNFNVRWNSINSACKDNELVKKNWELLDLPTSSPTWCAEACLVGSAAKKYFQHQQIIKNYDYFIARFCFILGDHYYSSLSPLDKFQSGYSLFANKIEDEEGEHPNQKLDEHLIGVSIASSMVVNALPTLIESLPCISDNEIKSLLSPLEPRFEKEFGWQYRTKEELLSIDFKHGFFGINMASSGSGKTIANVKIMTSIGLQSSEKVRLSLPVKQDNILRTKKVLQPFVELDENWKDNPHDLSEFIKNENYDFIRPPVLVCEITELLKASEGVHGITDSMIRLMTSDLIIDNIDEYKNYEIPALSRLIYLSGLMGRNVLISISDAYKGVAEELFTSYINGRNTHNLSKECVNVVWFTETCSYMRTYKNKNDIHIQKFIDHHQNFIKSINTHCISNKIGQVVFYEKDIVSHIHQHILTLHSNHYQSQDANDISFGFVQINNIDELVRIAKDLLAFNNPDNVAIHYCILHSQFPENTKDELNRKLDTLLNRKEHFLIFEQEDIKNTLKNGLKNIYVVLSDEISGDRDYDWGIIKDSKTNIHNCAGRVLRHRRLTHTTKPNLIFINQEENKIYKSGVEFKLNSLQEKKTFNEINLSGTAIWSAEVQRQQPFNGHKEYQTFRHINDSEWKMINRFNKAGELSNYEIIDDDVVLENSNDFWFDVNDVLGDVKIIKKLKNNNDYFIEEIFYNKNLGLY